MKAVAAGGSLTCMMASCISLLKSVQYLRVPQQAAHIDWILSQAHGTDSAV